MVDPIELFCSTEEYPVIFVAGAFVNLNGKQKECEVKNGIKFSLWRTGPESLCMHHKMPAPFLDIQLLTAAQWSAILEWNVRQGFVLKENGDYIPSPKMNERVGIDVDSNSVLDMSAILYTEDVLFELQSIHGCWWNVTNFPHGIIHRRALVGWNRESVTCL